MEPTEQDLKRLVALLRTVRTSKEIKLRYGAMQRQEIKEKLNKGEKVTGYRVQWLRESRDRIIKMLGEMAQEFNDKYPHDCISVADLGDVCISVLYYLKKAQES